MGASELCAAATFSDASNAAKTAIELTPFRQNAALFRMSRSGCFDMILSFASAAEESVNQRAR
jgi:hypothetical protein